MENLPCVSIIIPLYNASQYLESMFSQINCQTMHEFEVVIINDGSTDTTADIVRTYMQTDPRIRLIEQKNGGIGVARNTGLANAQGKYLTFLDADDLLHPRYIEVLYSTATKHSADISICQIEQLDDAAGIVTASPDRFPAHAYPKVFNPHDYADDLFGGFRTLAQAKMYKRSFVEEHNLHFAPLFRTDDLAFTAAALASAQCIAIADEDLYTYRVNNPHSSTSTRASFPLDFFEGCLLLKNYLEEHGLMPTYEKTYTQWVGLSCMLNLLELRDINAYSAVYRKLHQGGLAELGLTAPRNFGKPFGRKTASGAIMDSDIEKALHIIETHNEIAGTAKLLALAGKIKARKISAGIHTATSTAGTPLVSVLVPVYNTEQYLEQCLQSLMAQSLRDIEIICIDDGSTDTSPIILDAYAEQDERIRVIHKCNSGYGASMNLGLEKAHGLYIAICEPDDFFETTMLEKLSAQAVKENCDMVKCNYIAKCANNTEAVTLLDPYPYKQKLTLNEMPQLLFVAPSIWTGLYRRQMLLDEGIQFSETPGASFQDLSFSQQCLIAADSICLIPDALYCYRTDNADSSSKETGKVYAVCDEYQRSFTFLAKRFPENQELLAPWLNAARMGNYAWNYNRIAPECRQAFVERWAQEMQSEKNAGRIQDSILPEEYKHLLELLLAKPSQLCEHYPTAITLPPLN